MDGGARLPVAVEFELIEAREPLARATGASRRASGTPTQK
jgi:hypothetical protein